jgi:hypothetical protein
MGIGNDIMIPPVESRFVSLGEEFSDSVTEFIQIRMGEHKISRLAFNKNGGKFSLSINQCEYQTVN